MAKIPSPESKEQTSEPPAPEVLKPQADETTQAPEAASPSTSSLATKAGKRRGTYRPSHKATFIGLAAVVAILAVNAGIIGFVLKGQSKSKTQANQGQVTISQGVLDKLGVSRNSIGQSGIQLVVNPDARFNGDLQVDGNVNVAGQFKLNSKFTATDASLTQLEAGNTSLAQLNVNGDGTVSSLSLRKDLVVTGATRLQGPVTLSQLLTINNSVNISGNLSVGGTLSVNSLHVSSFIADSTVTIGGHVITRGSAPGVGPGSALGSNGTVSISGNDASGTVAANIGTGAGSGIVANVAFRTQYSNIPHVVVTAIGAGVGSVYVNRSASGFSIGVNGALSPGGYAFDYIVEQ
jgi:cytoskeletal protein CcmA (bactofilin family)